MAELVFIAGEKNKFKVSEDGIHVEFNVCEQSVYLAMIFEMSQLLRQLGIGCTPQICEFVRFVQENDELWAEDGTWAGLPCEKRYPL